jgi:hypothetical protein
MGDGEVEEFMAEGRGYRCTGKLGRGYGSGNDMEFVNGCQGAGDFRYHQPWE